MNDDDLITDSLSPGQEDPSEESHTTTNPNSGDNATPSPAVQDANSASGHTTDLEADDNVDDLGAEAGINYSQAESLGIEKKVHVTTETEPPTTDEPS